jgi:cyclopropane-fatty-acyl-phospholipid synthase
MTTMKHGFGNPLSNPMGNPLGVSSRDSMPTTFRVAGWGGSRKQTTAFEQWLLMKMLKRLKRLGNPPVTITAWDGWTVTNENKDPATGDAGKHFRLYLHDSTALRQLAFDPEYQFGELYSNGGLDVDGDLAELIELIYATQKEWRKSLFNRLLPHFHPPRSNLLGQAKANIHHHYDIGEAFYRLWLDPQLIYTCAYFPSPSASLETAQREKMDLICRKLRLKPGERVVEAGCGWGALALFMAREYSVNVHAFNISRHQIEHARQRAKEEGLQNRVSFVEADYRAIRGEYDVFVSVGMLEHVGRAHYSELGHVIDRCLAPNGRGLIHSIGTDVVTPLNPWIERRIFPGAYPPTLRQAMTVFETANLSVLDIENLRLHYAKTLEHWLARFEAAQEEVEALFDPTFVRAWRIYLAGSLAAFRSGRLQLFQMLFQRNGDNDLPWTRADLYHPHHDYESSLWNASTS